MREALGQVRVLHICRGRTSNDAAHTFMMTESTVMCDDTVRDADAQCDRISGLEAATCIEGTQRPT